MSYLKRDLPGEDKQELLGLTEDYRQELVPLIVPLTLLQYHLRRHTVPEWVWEQVYLQPYPNSIEKSTRKCCKSTIGFEAGMKIPVFLHTRL